MAQVTWKALVMDMKFVLLDGALLTRHRWRQQLLPRHDDEITYGRVVEVCSLWYNKLRAYNIVLDGNITMQGELKCHINGG